MVQWEMKNLNLTEERWMDISETGLLENGELFTLHEGHHIHDFEWLAFERLQDEYFYPIFLKTNIYNLPKQFTIRTEYE